MDRSGTPERHQRVIAGIASPLNRDDPHGALHIRVGHDVNAPRRLADGQPQGIGDDPANTLLRGGTIERHGATVEVVGVEIAKNQIGVRHGWRGPALAVTHGTGVRTRAFRSHGDQSEIRPGDAAAPRTYFQKLHGRDVEGNTTSRSTIDHGHFELRHDGRLAAVDRTELRSRTTHVKGEQVLLTFFPADNTAHHHAGCRTGLNDTDRHVSCQLRRDQARIRLHDEDVAFDPTFLQRAFEISKVAVDDRFHVSVGERRAEALKLTHLRRDLGRNRNRHVRMFGDDGVTHQSLMAAVGIGMDEGHRCRLVAPIRDGLDHARDAGGIDRLYGLTVDIDPFIDLEDILSVDQRYGLGQIDVEGIVSLLPPHDDDVAESLGRDEGGPRSLTLDNGVRGDRRCVKNHLDIRSLDPALVEHVGQSRQHGAAWIVGRARHLPEPHAAVRGILKNEIREGAANIESNLNGVGCCAHAGGLCLSNRH